MEENIKTEEEKPIIKEIEMIEVTRPAVVESIPKQDILDLISEDEQAISEYTENIRVRTERIAQYQSLLT
jgi:hypothetical protein